MKKFCTLSLIPFIILFAGCDNWQGPKDSQDYVVSLDIMDVKYLCTSTKQSSASTNLYKITNTDGDIIPASFLNADLTPVDPSFFNINVEHYYRLDEDLICLSGQFELFNDTSSNEKITLSSILIDLNTGNIFDFMGHFPEDLSYYLGSPFVQKDTTNNYYYSFNAKIFKLSKLDNKSYSIVQYIPDGQRVNGYFIDKAGNCFYYTSNSENLKVKLSAGGIIISDNLFHDMFYDGYNLMAIHHDELVKVTLDSTISFESVDRMQNDIEYCQFSYENREQKYTLLLLGGYSSLNSGYFGLIYLHEQEVIRPLNIEIQNYDASNIHNVVALLDHYLFLSPQEKSAVVRIDLKKIEGITDFVLDQTEVVTVPESYDIYSLRISDPNTITLVGLNYNDEKIYVFEMDFESNITIISEAPSKSFEILDLIN